MPDIRHLVVRGRYENIPTITSFISEAAQAAGLSESAVFHCQMAADEACTNVIEHAYNGEDNGDITITCTVSSGHCQIEILDAGEPFNPEAVPIPRVDGALEDIRPGGIGLHLMRKVMDQVEFSFTDEGNHLLMVKRGEPVPDKSGTTSIPYEMTDTGLIIVTPQGRMDSAAAPNLEEILSQLQEEGRLQIVVDLSQVSYISSRGLKALVKAWRVAESAGGNVVLSGMTSNVFEVFDTVGFTQVFDIYSAVQDAQTGLQNP